MRVAVVGAGVSGLALAYTLVRDGGDAVDVTVFEAGPRPGGLIRTERRDGYLCEWWPNGFLDRAPDTFALLQSLGVGDRVVASSAHARRRFVLRDGRLRQVPTSLGTFLTGDVLSLRGRLRLALEPFVPRGQEPDESIHGFAARRFGREVADVLVDAFTTGIFAGPSRDLSIRACFPQLWQLEQHAGSVVRGMFRRRKPEGAASPSPFGRLVSMAGGMEEIVAALARQLGSRLRLNDPIDRIERRTGSSAWALSRAHGDRVTADRLVVATGAAAAARLLAPVDAELASLVGGIRTAPLAVLSLGYDAAAADAALEGFGFLVPRGESARILGAVWDSSVFPDRVPPGHTLIRVIMGGGRDPGVVSLDDRELVARARADLRAVCGVTSDPAFVHVVRHVPGLPQYVVGHADRVAAIEARLEEHPGLTLIGNSYQGLAVNACISTARRAAHRLAGRPSDDRPDPPRL